MVFPQQQNAMGSLHNLDFGVFWARWGGSGKEPGSGNRFREPKVVPFDGFGQVPGFRRWFQVSMSSNRFRFGKWLRFRRF